MAIFSAYRAIRKAITKRMATVSTVSLDRELAKDIATATVDAIGWQRAAAILEEAAKIAKAHGA